MVNIRSLLGVSKANLPEVAATLEKGAEDRRAFAHRVANIVGDGDVVDELTSTEVCAEVCQREFSFIPN